MKYVALLLLGLMITPIALVASASSTRFATYNVNLSTENLNLTTTITVETSSGHPYNNTVIVNGQVTGYNATTKLDYSTSYMSNYSLVQQLLSNNISALLNNTLNIMRSGKFGNLTYNISLHYGSGGTTSVVINGQTLQAQLHNLTAYLFLSLLYNRSIFGTPLTLSYQLRSSAHGFVEVLPDGLLYAAQLQGTATSYHGADFMGTQVSDQGSTHSLTLDIALTSTNIVGDPTTNYTMFIVPAVGASAVVLFLVLRKFF